MGGFQDVFASVTATVEGLADRPNVTTPSGEELRKRAQRIGTKTDLGSYNYSSVVRSRSAGLTVYVGGPEVLQASLNPRQEEILDGLGETIALVDAYVKRAPLLQTIRRMGQNDEFSPLCTLYLSSYRPEVVRLAHFFHLALFDPDGGEVGPRMTLVDLPESSSRRSRRRTSSGPITTARLRKASSGWGCGTPSGRGCLACTPVPRY